MDRIYYTLQLRSLMVIGDLVEVVSSGRRMKGIGERYMQVITERMAQAGLDS